MDSTELLQRVGWTSAPEHDSKLSTAQGATQLALDSGMLLLEKMNGEPLTCETVLEFRRQVLQTYVGICTMIKDLQGREEYAVIAEACADTLGKIDVILAELVTHDHQGTGFSGSEVNA